MTTAEATSEGPIVPSNYWWIVLLQGIAGVIIGILLFTDPRIQSGQMPEFSRETFRAILPIVTR